MIACRAAAGCTRDLYARGLCQKHYFAERRAGAHTRDERYGCAAARFWSKVALPSGQFGCLEWQGARSTNGYGMFWLDGRQGGAHRWSYERLVGPVPDGLELDHLCANRGCVRPDHLEPVTHRENLRRRGKARVSGEGA